MSGTPGGARPRSAFEVELETRTIEAPEVGLVDEDRGIGTDGKPNGAPDYFGDAVPLRGDRDLRERDERIRRLEQARPKARSARPSLRFGALAAIGVLLLAVGIAFLGRSSPRKATYGQAPVRQPAPTEIAPLPVPAKIGLAPAVAVAAPPPRERRRHGAAHPDRVPRSQEPGGDTQGAPAQQIAIPPVEAETAGVEKAVTEPQPETAEAPRSDPTPPAAEPKPEPEATSAGEEKSGNKSSTSEANEQFGFGR